MAGGLIRKQAYGAAMTRRQDAKVPRDMISDCDQIIGATRHVRGIEHKSPPNFSTPLKLAVNTRTLTNKNSQINIFWAFTVESFNSPPSLAKLATDGLL